MNDAENLLLNTLCLEEDEPLDLRGITDIDEDALIGCKSNQVIHTEDIVNVSVKAFEKSGLACMKKPFVDGVKMAGTIACDFNKNAEKYIIPNFATAILWQKQETTLRISLVYTISFIVVYSGLVELILALYRFKYFTFASDIWSVPINTKLFGTE